MEVNPASTEESPSKGEDLKEAGRVRSSRDVSEYLRHRLTRLLRRVQTQKTVNEAGGKGVTPGKGGSGFRE